MKRRRGVVWQWVMFCMVFWGAIGGQNVAQTPEILPEVPLIETDPDTINVMLLGTATINMATAGLTDSMLLLSLNTRTRHVAIVSIPRDLYVYIPTIGMGKLNQAYHYGERDLEDGITGSEMVKQTILYNLGVDVDYYARVNFTNFKRLIDRVGGIEISVDCVIEDWRLISPELDPNVAENWALFTLENGVHVMNGDLALWYARSRRTSLDTDRGRRHQDILRALWRKIQARGLLADLPALWESWGDIVETDMPLETALALAPVVAQFNTDDIGYYGFQIGREVTEGYTPDKDRRFILIPDRPIVERLMREVVAPSSTSTLAESRPRVGIVNVSGVPYMARVASDRLELEGFRTEILTETASPRQWNLIIDYTGLEKGNPITRIQRALATTDDGIQQSPQATRPYDYKVYLGANYPYYACTRPVRQPKPTPEAPPEATNAP